VIADWKLERYRLKELSAEEMASVETALRTDESLRARLAALGEDDEATLAKYPAIRVVEAVAARSVRSERRWLVPALALAAAMTAGVVMLRPPVAADDITLKGDQPSLVLFRLAGTDPQRLADGTHVKPHDVVQVSLNISGATHLVIVSVDGAAHTMLHWPLDGNTKAPAGLKALPQAFELDDAPGFERFFLVTGNTPIDVAATIAAAQHAGRTEKLELPATLGQRSVLLNKDSP
jgi:hypothetical protein